MARHKLVDDKLYLTGYFNLVNADTGAGELQVYSGLTSLEAVRAGIAK